MKEDDLSCIIQNTLYSPFLATPCCIVPEQIQALKSIRLHPIFIVVPPDTVLFINQVGKILRRVACFGTPNILSFGRRKWAMSWCPWEVYWPWKWRVGIVAGLQASCGASELFIAALLSRAVDLKLVWLIHLGTAVPGAKHVCSSRIRY